MTWLGVFLLFSGEVVTLETGRCLELRSRLERGQTQKVAIETKWVTEIYEVASISCIRKSKPYRIALR